MDYFQQRNELNVYAENALNNILEDLTLKPLDISNHFCMEIDDTRDLALAKSYFNDSGGKKHVLL